MSARLEYVEVENFKSFRKKQRIGPFKPFTALIGPNGSGKSNFMDAISFVMGEKVSNLRVDRASDLIHGAVIGKPTADRASVKAVFHLDDATKRHFSISIQSPALKYYFNEVLVTRKQYLQELKEIGINVNAKNFLVFQGDIETLAMGTPVERTSVFEQISGSGRLKDECKRRKKEMLKAEEEVHVLFENKKGNLAEKRDVNSKLVQANRYQCDDTDLTALKVELQLFLLYHNQKETDHVEDELHRRQGDLDTIQMKKEEMSNTVLESKERKTKASQKLVKVEQEIERYDAEILRKGSEIVKSKEKLTHLKRKFENACKSLTQASRAHDLHEETIQVYENELKAVETRRQNYEEQVAKESQSQGRNIHLEATQEEQYHKLKQEVGLVSAVTVQQRDSLSRERTSLEDKLDNEGRKLSEIKEKIRRKTYEKYDTLRRMENLRELVCTTQEALEEQSVLRSTLTLETEEISTMQEELVTVMKELEKAYIDMSEHTRLEKKREVVENLKRLNPGVYDRMINLCKPMNHKYKLAITRVFGQHMASIVVDTEETAKQCIRYLKEQELHTETFLPLSNIQPEPIKQHLRSMEKSLNVHLAHDVLSFDQSVESAVLFVTKNTLICENSHNAEQIAYGFASRNTVVTLDGSVYYKSGLITGGSLDLARRATQWDMERVSLLKARKVELIKKVCNKGRQKSELTTVESCINSLTRKLKYFNTDLDKNLNHIEEVDRDLQNLEQMLQDQQSKIAEIDKCVQEQDRQLQILEEEITSIEDDIFHEFCIQIGVQNIRQYENHGLRIQQKRQQQLQEFEDLTNRIKNQLDFERSHDTKGAVLKWKHVVQDAKHAFKTEQESFQECCQVVEDLRSVLDSLEAKKLNISKIIDEVTASLTKAEKREALIRKDYGIAIMDLEGLANKLKNLRAHRHFLLKQCKVEGIKIPVLQGSVEDVTIESSEGSSADSNVTLQEIYDQESRITVDYSQLKDDLKTMREPEEVQKVVNDLKAMITNHRAAQQSTGLEKNTVVRRLAMLDYQLQETSRELHESHERARNARLAFERVQHARFNLFQACFSHVCDEIDSIYKLLTRSRSGTALLTAENPEEPYEHGIAYCCIVPGKSCQPMETASGGEKAIAALALLVALHTFNPAPFFFLDEIDAALDNSNLKKVATFFNERKASMQTIIISHSRHFYSLTDALIGISPDGNECTESKALHLDLSKYRAR